MRFQTSAPYVGSQPGFRLLFVCLLIAGILGVGVHILISPQRVRQALEASFQKVPAPHSVFFDRAELRLSRGIWPTFSIWISQLQVLKQDSCGPLPQFEADEVYVPLSLSSLLSGEVTAGVVYAPSVTVRAIVSKCSELPGVTTSESALPPVAEAPAKVEIPVTASSGLNTEKVQKLLQERKAALEHAGLVRGLVIQKLQVLLPETTQVLELRKLAVDLSQLTVEVQLPSVWTWGEVVPPLMVELDLSDENAAELSVSTNLSEGTIEALAMMKTNVDGLPIETQISLSNIPLSALLPYVQKLKIAPDELKFRRMWLTCEVALSGSIQDLYNKNPVRLSKCGAEGEMGQIVVNEATWDPASKWRPFQMHFQNIDLKSLLQSFGKTGPTGIVGDFGRLEGSLQFETAEKMHFKGGLKGLSLLFSNHSVRAQQVIDEIATEVFFENSNIKGEIKDIRLAKGIHKGHVKFNIHTPTQKGEAEVEVQKLEFDPAIQKLMLDGDISGLRLVGDLRWEKDKVVHWKGELAADKIDAAALKVKNLQLKSSWDGQRFVMHGQDFDAEANISQMKWLHPMFLGHKFDSDWIRLQKVAGQVEVDAERVRWRRSSATLANGRIWMQSSGEVSKLNNILGSFQVDFPKVKKVRWAIKGTTKKPKLESESPWIRRGVTWSDSALGL